MKTGTPNLSIAVFLAELAKRGLPAPVAELQFARPRRWRIDYAWPEQKVALEIQGGVWTRGAHVRGDKMLREWEKLNYGAGIGWRFLFCQPTELTAMRTLDEIEKALKYTP